MACGANLDMWAQIGVYVLHVLCVSVGVMHAGSTCILIQRYVWYGVYIIPE